MSVDYETSCKQATTAQGLDPAVDALAKAGIDAAVEQTGGFTMVLYSYTDSGRPDTPAIGITSGDEEDSFLVVGYENISDIEDEGTILASTAKVEALPQMVRDFHAAR